MHSIYSTELLEFYSEEHGTHSDCQGALVMLQRTTEIIRHHLEDSENFQLLCELQRDLGGFVALVNNNRVFIRQGCLLKHSKRGLQQRIFFLVCFGLASSLRVISQWFINSIFLRLIFQFSDVLLYGSKSPVNQQFRILGHVPLRSLMTENGEQNIFIIYGGQKAITVSAGTTAEKTLWLAELAKATTEIKSKPHVQLSLGTLKNCSKYHNNFNCSPQNFNLTKKNLFFFCSKRFIGGRAGIMWHKFVKQITDR